MASPPLCIFVPMAKRRYHSLKIPIKPYLRKYAHRLYGPDIFANRETALGALICLSLEKEIYESRHQQSEKKRNLYTDALPVFVSDWHWTAIGFEVSPEAVAIINSFLENLFNESLYMYCTIHSSEAGRYKGFNKAYYKFCIDYGLDIDTDITMDALKKKEYRYRLQLERKAQAVHAKSTLF